MRVFKVKEFHKWANKTGLTDKDLFDSALEVADKNVEASLGKKVFKKRIAIEGEGKRGGARTIVAFQEGNNLIYMYGFRKNKSANIKPKLLKELQMVAEVLLRFTDAELNKAVKNDILFEVKQDER
ncbi:MAG: type II toxin-antitoxin system RelE/ParE family toxin [Thiohalomonadales bacterium]